MERCTDSDTLRVLVASGDRGEESGLRRLLEAPGKPHFAVAWVETLSAFLDRLGAAAWDAAVLDLDLVDGDGVGTVGRIQESAPGVPLVVVSGEVDSTLARRAAEAGAQDYLLKGRWDRALLSRVVRYARERHGLQQELKRARERQQEERELRLLEGLTRTTLAPVTAELYGDRPLQESLPLAFAELVQKYGVLLDARLQEQCYRVAARSSEPVRALASRLGFLRAGPRDVMDLHAQAMRDQARGAPEARSLAYLEEGRFLVLEVMGYLVAYYRNYCSWGSGPQTANEAP